MSFRMPNGSVSTNRSLPYYELYDGRFAVCSFVSKIFIYVANDKNIEYYLLHAKLKEKSEILLPLAGTSVAVGAGDRILFAGILKEVQITHEGAAYHVVLTGVSATDQLDHGKKNRSFQDISMTYGEVMKQVLADTPGARIWFHGTDQTIRNPLYQIGETDWAFIKRLAGRLHTVLIPSVYAAAVWIHSGVPDGNVRKADSGMVCERIWCDRKHRDICRRVRTSQNWEVGDQIDWEGYRYFISTKECRLEKGLLQFYYTLTGAAAFQTEQCENPYLTGLMLPASVIDVRDEEVKVKFDMDPVQPAESAYWYPWQSDMGNLAYCMPEKGEQVYIHPERKQYTQAGQDWCGAKDDCVGLEEEKK